MKKTNKKNFFKQNRKIKRSKKVKKVKQELVVTEKQQKIVGTLGLLSQIAKKYQQIYLLLKKIWEMQKIMKKF